MKCCNKEMNAYMDFKFWSYALDCEIHNSAGEMYLGDGVYTSCECWHGHGRKVKFVSCDVCGTEVRDSGNRQGGK